MFLDISWVSCLGLLPVVPSPPLSRCSNDFLTGLWHKAFLQPATIAATVEVDDTSGRAFFRLLLLLLQRRRELLLRSCWWADDRDLEVRLPVPGD